MRFHKIVCAIDFSPGSDAAVQTAARIADEHGAELVLAHAWYVAPASASLDHSLIRQIANEAERVLEATRKLVAAAGSTRVSAKLLVGVPWHALVELAEHELDIDLLVLGARGRTGLARFLLGSVSEKVLRHAPCSVLIVRPGTPPTPFAHAAVAIDFSVDAEHATELASALVEPSGEITLIHATESPTSEVRDSSIAALVRDLADGANQRLEVAADELRQRASARVTTTLIDGRSPGARLVEAIESDPTLDLVITGSHGRTGIRRVLLGSVAERIARHTAIPVLVSRSRVHTS